ARPTSGPAVDVTLEPLVHAEPRPLEDFRVEIATIVHDDEHRRARYKPRDTPPEHSGDPVCVLLDRSTARAARRRPELELPTVVQGEQLVGVPMLLVVVDETGIRRRREDRLVPVGELDLACVAVQDGSR